MINTGMPLNKVKKTMKRVGISNKNINDFLPPPKVIVPQP